MGYILKIALPFIITIINYVGNYYVQFKNGALGHNITTVQQSSETKHNFEQWGELLLEEAVSRPHSQTSDCRIDSGSHIRAELYIMSFK